MDVAEFYNVIIRHSHNSLDNWQSNNPILDSGVLGYVDGSPITILKFGDGETHWNDLPEFKPNHAGNADTVQGYSLFSGSKFKTDYFPDEYTFGNFKLSYNASQDSLDISYSGGA